MLAPPPPVVPAVPWCRRCPPCRRARRRRPRNLRCRRVPPRPRPSSRAAPARGAAGPPARPRRGLRPFPACCRPRRSCPRCRSSPRRRSAAPPVVPPSPVAPALPSPAAPLAPAVPVPLLPAVPPCRTRPTATPENAGSQEDVRASHRNDCCRKGSNSFTESAWLPARCAAVALFPAVRESASGRICEPSATAVRYNGATTLPTRADRVRSDQINPSTSPSPDDVSTLDDRKRPRRRRRHQGPWQRRR